MAPSHRYDLIKDTDDTKDESDNNDRSVAVVATPWTKYILYMLLAFSAGLGAAVGVVLTSHFLKPSDGATATASATAAGVSAASSTLSADVTLSTTSATLDTDLLSPTDSAEHKTVDPPIYAGKVLECGWSPEEARKNGCVYDVMMQDWVPPPCYDGVLTERYLARGNYTWWTDLEGHTMTDEEMRKGEHGKAWMSASYHKDHCIFSWEKLIRALRNNEPISQELLSYDHVLHCQHQTLGEGHHKRDDDEAVSVGAPTNYAKCALYNTWRNDFIPDRHSSVEK